MKRLPLAAATAALVACTDRPTLMEPTDAPVPAADPQVSAAVEGLLPDLRTVVPQDLRRVVNARGREILRFTNSIANTGRGPFHVVPRYNAREGTQDAIQWVFDASGTVVQRKVVSQYGYHSAHDHWHIAGVALYQVRSGSLTGPIVGNASKKTTFCLIDISRLAGFSNPAPQTYTECNAGAQGISRGWVDEYGYWLAGQGLDITGAPLGVYYLVSKANPAGKFIEARYSNNRAWVKFEIRRNALGHRTIRILGHSSCTGGLCG
jgi:hypothetical protein